MICTSCGRKVDPDRSFCPNCGSASFADESDARLRLASLAQALSSPGTAETVARVRARMPPQRPRPRPQAARSPAPHPPAAAAASAGCIAALVRLVIFIAVVWYVGTWLFGIPEVANLRDAVLAGSFSDQQVNAALDAIRERIADLLR